MNKFIGDDFYDAFYDDFYDALLKVVSGIKNENNDVAIILEKYSEK